MILAIDLGSSSFRAAVFTPDGQLQPETLARRATVATTAPDGTMTYDAAILWTCFTTVISRSLHLADRQGYAIQGVGISTMMHSLMGVRQLTTHTGRTSVGTPTTPVFAWGDTRSEAERENFVEYFNRHRLYARTGCPLHSSYWLLKLAWLRRHLALREWQWMSFADYAWWRLFGQTCTSISLASATGLYARCQVNWDEAIIEELGLKLSNLAPLASSDWSLPGTDLRSPFKQRWPQLHMARFFPPLGDGACSNLGNLCFSDERAAINIGTTAALRITVPRTREPEEPPPGLWVYHLDHRSALIGGALSNAGNLLAWGRRTLRLPPKPVVEANLCKTFTQDTGLTILPFLAGERSLGWSPQSTGLITGLRLPTSPVAIWQALLEVIALRMAWIAHELKAAGFLADTTEIIASGGVLSSPVFATMLCQALGRPIYVTQNEASARGAALWVSLRLGLITPDRCPLPAGIRFQPDPMIQNSYRERLERHRIAYQKLAEIWSKA
ncbi:MAG: gluconokinase [Acidobacteriota bacterium]